MDGISAASSVLAIGTAGVQISIRLLAFANQVKTASDRIQSIGSDVSLTANVLQQLSDLMNKRDEAEGTSIFSKEALFTVTTSANTCKSAFETLEAALGNASDQVRAKRNITALGTKIVLSKLEALKWPFLQPGIDTLQAALSTARHNLMLILHVTTLAYMKKLAEQNKPSVFSINEQSQLINAILAMQRPPTASKINRALEPETVSERINTGELVEATEQSPPLDREKDRDLGCAGISDGTVTNPPPLSPSQQSQSTSQAWTGTKAETWIITPKLNERKNVAGRVPGCIIRWTVSILPLEPQAVNRRTRHLFSWAKKIVLGQVGDLTTMESKVLDHYLTKHPPGNGGGVVLKSIEIRKMHPSKEPITRMPWRCFYVVVERSMFRDAKFRLGEKLHSSHTSLVRHRRASPSFERRRTAPVSSERRRPPLFQELGNDFSSDVQDAENIFLEGPSATMDVDGISMRDHYTQPLRSSSRRNLQKPLHNEAAYQPFYASALYNPFVPEDDARKEENPKEDASQVTACVGGYRKPAYFPGTSPGSSVAESIDERKQYALAMDAYLRARDELTPDRRRRPEQKTVGEYQNRAEQYGAPDGEGLVEEDAPQDIEERAESVFYQHPQSQSQLYHRGSGIGTPTDIMRFRAEREARRRQVYHEVHLRNPRQTSTVSTGYASSPDAQYPSLGQEDGERRSAKSSAWMTVRAPLTEPSPRQGAEEQGRAGRLAEEDLVKEEVPQDIAELANGAAEDVIEDADEEDALEEVPVEAAVPEGSYTITSQRIIDDLLSRYTTIYD